MRWGTIAVVGLCLGCNGDRPTGRIAPPGAPSQAASPIAEPERGYSVAPLLQSLRPGLRAAPVARGADRLPLYELDLDVEDTTFAVRETLWFTNEEPAALPDLVLRVYANAGAPTSATTAEAEPRVHLLGARCLGAAACRIEQVSPSALRVVPARPLQPGERLRVQLELGGTLPQIDPARLDLLAQGVEGLASLGGHTGATDYGLLGSGDGVRSLANFYAVLARRDQQGWQLADASTLGDLGSDRLAHVRLRLVLPKGMRAIASGVAVGAPQELASGKHVEQFDAGFVRDVSVLVSDKLQTREALAGDVRVRSHFLAEDAVAGERVLLVAQRALELFERSFGPYPYPDLDVVEAPLVGGAGGVEFSGLVTVASMLYRKPGSRSGQKLPALASQQALFDAMLELVTAHEVAHQYWHGLVGSDSRATPFLDEGLAQYSALLYVQAAHGKARAAQEAERQVAMNYRLMRLLGFADAPVSQPVAAFGSPVEYAGLVYGKGPLLYRALADALGEQAFLAVLRQYVKDWAFRVAPPKGLFETFVRMGHAPKVAPLWKRWLEERHGDEDVGVSGGLAGLLGGTGGGSGAAGDSSAMLRLLTQALGEGAPGADSATGLGAIDLAELERMLDIAPTERGVPDH